MGSMKLFARLLEGEPEPDSATGSRGLMGQILTPEQLRDLMANLLEGAAGETCEHWRGAIGDVKQLEPLWANVRTNWAVEPQGRKSDLRAIEHAVEVVRAEHPYVLRA